MTLTNRALTTICAALLLALAAACSDDGAAVPDATAADSATDQALVDQAVQPDGPTADQGSDGTATPDAVKPDAADPKCGGVQCNLKNDCCDCAAWHNAGPSPPPCTNTSCKQPTCGGLGLKTPAAYCYQGHCSVRDDGTTCSSDADCKLNNDCCWCQAWPKAALAPSCPNRSCLVATCTSKGLSTVKARCIGGICRLGL